MKKLNNYGFSIGQVLLVIVVVGLIGGVGYFVYQRQNQPVITNFDECVAAGNPVMESYPEQCSANGKTFTNAAVTQKVEASGQVEAADTITDLSDKPIVMRYPADASKLDNLVPKSFQDYVRLRLRSNKPDNTGCVQAWIVQKTSVLNIGGQVASVPANSDEATEDCLGGSAAFWYLQESKWNLYTAQMMDVCSAIAKTSIYIEFISSCFKTYDDQDNVLPNPNGSLKDAL